MKRDLKSRWIGILLLLFLGLLLFTPLGFYLRVYANRILSRNPVPVEERQQQVLEDYDWSLMTLDGEAYDFEDCKGKLTFINFWATWCPPCVAEMPSLQKLYDDYGKEVNFLFVARDREERVEAFLKKNGYNLPVYYERGLVPSQIYYGGLPTTFIISSEGRIVLSTRGSANWDGEGTRNLLDSLLTRSPVP